MVIDRRLRYGITLIVLAASLLSGCTGLTQTPVNPTPIPPGDQVEALLMQMTLDEKIGQMTQVEKNSIQPEDVKKYFIGSVISGGGGSPAVNTTSEWTAMIRQYQQAALETRLAIPMIYGLDAVHGHGNLYGATIFPQEIGLGAAHNPDLVRQIGAATAEEMLASGVTWNFAPVVAVPQDIRWGRTYEAYGEDTDLVSQLGAALIGGLQSIPDNDQPAAGQTLYTLATAKHFLGDGGTNFGSSTQVILQPYLLDQGDMTLDESLVRQLFLPAYKAAVDAGVQSVMVSFSSWNGSKLHASKYWITDVLKNELGFQGLVVSDWGGIDQIDKNYSKAVTTAINAGIDMNMVPYDYKRFISTLKIAVEQGGVPIERVDDAVRRILRVKLALGLFAEPFPSAAEDVVGSEAHRALARQSVRESLVLLKNDDDVLPLSKTKQQIYVGGQGAADMGMQCGGWTIEWQGKNGAIEPGTTLLQGIQAAVTPDSSVEYSPDGQFTGTADVGIAVVGEQPYAEGVGDRKSLTLSEKDITLIQILREHSRKLVIIILSGRPMVITPQFNQADGWVAAWLPGTEGGGVSDVLFGDYPFTGTLPYAWPRSNDQLPLNERTSEGKTGCATPLFPRGFGLGQGGSQPQPWIDCP